MSFTADRYIQEEIAKLQPGHAITFSRLVVESVPPRYMLGLAGPRWSSEDVILEGLMGSSYDITHHSDHLGNITFERRRQPLTDNRRTHVSPDRRHLFKQDEQGFWTPKE